MHIKCPACGSVNSLDSLLAAEDGAADVVQLAGEMEPAAWRLAVQYLGLFRPRKSKLSWARTSTILGEVAGMIKSAQFERGGQIFSAPLPYWLHGMERVLAQRDGLTLPLKTHGYLLEIMMSLDAKTVGLAEKKERVSRKDEGNKEPDPPPPEQTSEQQEEPPPVKPLSEEAQKAKDQFYEALGKMGVKVRHRSLSGDPEAIRREQIKQLEAAAEIKRRLKEEEQNHEHDSNP